MKKSILVSLLFIVFTTAVYSQDKPFSLGVRGGMNLSSLKVDYGTTDPKIGYQAGIVVEYKLPCNFFVQSGLSYSMRYGKEDLSYSMAYLNGYNPDYHSEIGYVVFETRSNIKVKSHYLQVPVSIGYKLNVNKDFSLNYNLGTYFSYGVDGKTKGGSVIAYEVNATSELISSSMYQFSHYNDNTFSDSVFKRFDMGMLFGMGAEYKRITLNMNYELGLKNMSQNSECHNRNLVFSLGYRIF